VCSSFRIEVDLSILGVMLMFLIKGYVEYQFMRRVINESGSLRKYFRVTWNVFELANLSVMAFFLLVNAVAALLPMRRRWHPPSIAEFVDIEALRILRDLQSCAQGISFIITAFTFFKFLELSPVNSAGHVLGATLDRAGLPLKNFCFFLLILLQGFVVVGMQLFGDGVAEFSTYSLAFHSQIRIITGGSEVFRKMFEYRPELALMYGFLLIGAVSTLIFPIFVAVLYDSFVMTEARMQIVRQRARELSKLNRVQKYGFSEAEKLAQQEREDEIAARIHEEEKEQEAMAEAVAVMTASREAREGAHIFQHT